MEGLKVFFVNFGQKEAKYIIPMLSELRNKGISSEIYPSPAKMKKQMTYANAKGAKYVVLIGTNEIEAGLISVKNMVSGNQEEITFKDFLNKI